MEKPTIQKILAQHLPQLLSSRGFSFDQYKALKQLSQCRTAALGGHTQYCPAGHFNGIWYNSCKHRFCPQCRGMPSEEWLRNTQKILLNCPHHHIIFTIPSELNTLWRYNRAEMMDLLFKATHQTLNRFSNDTRYLGATPGILSTLHTWGRDLCLHPHVHVLVSHGGLDKTGTWVEPKKTTLFPRKPVMMIFRGILRELIQKALDKGALVLPPDRRISHLYSLLNKLGRKEWVVHFCKRYDYADGVAKYLARYVKGGPCNNAQLQNVTSTQVNFRYRSHVTARTETVIFTINDFIQRLLEHVVPARKPSVRYCGLYTSACRERLNQARKACGQDAVSQRELLTWQTYLEDKSHTPSCEVCGLPLAHREAVLRTLKAA